ncbi:hypothetical protein IMX26_14545 [Clostridium sp. 'deep sea']|nr:hypothetical protein IMX26_14545 [Clostridium sp. 'deep sea']
MALSVAMIVPAFADVHGGWDEDTGYFKTKLVNRDSLNIKLSAQNDPKHTGKREREDIDGTTNYRAHGWTTWVDVYHYTRARMEERNIFGQLKRVLTDSGQQYGTSGTEAKSPWWPFDPDVNEKARTYYGRP